MKETKKENSLSDLIFKILLAIAILALIVIIAQSPMANFSLNDNSLRDQSNKKMEKTMPSELKWHDSFKGISNEKKDDSKDNMNFMK